MPPPGGVRTDLSGFVASARFSTKYQGPYGPGLPLQPVWDIPVRVNDYRPGQNTAPVPRYGEEFSFAQLRAFSNVEMVRLAIETRKDQIERLDWQIKTKDGRKARGDAEQRVNRVTRFFRKPDGVTPFATWLRSAMEDLLVLDAPAFELRRNFGGQLIGLDVVPGDTIKTLVDDTGRRPKPPEPAYQQWVRGFTVADLTAEELLYLPRNVRPNHLYGFGPVEQILVTINTLLNRQAAQLAHFTDGNIPAGMATVPEGWAPQHIKEWQDWVDSQFAGNAAMRSKLLWAPFGSTYKPFKEAPIKDEFDEWLARIVCFAFSLSPTPFIRQLNRSTSETSDESSLEEGLEPLKAWVKRFLDGIIADELGCADLEFAWVKAQDIDPLVQAQVHDYYIRNGTLPVDEVRDELGKDPVKGGDKPMIYTAKGAVLLAVAAGLEEDPNAEPDPDNPDTDPAAKDGKDAKDEDT